MVACACASRNKLFQTNATYFPTDSQLPPDSRSRAAGYLKNAEEFSITTEGKSRELKGNTDKGKLSG